jgi:hypothetical protein
MAASAQADVINVQPGATKPLTFEEFKKACVDPAAFQAQIPPSQIRVTCSEVSTTWKPAGSSFFNLGATREITSALVSNKFNTSKLAQTIYANPAQGTCNRYQEVMQKIAVDVSLTCQQVVSIKTNLTDFCQSSLDSARAGNPGLVTETSTGNTVSTCNGGSTGGTTNGNTSNGQTTGNGYKF